MAAVPAPPSITKPNPPNVNNNYNNNNNSQQQQNDSNPQIQATPSNINSNNPNNQTPQQFNFTECSKYLSSRHTAAMEALASNQTPLHEKPELYKPPGANSLSGGWGSGKYTSMSDGSDFLTSLYSKIDQKLHPHHPLQHQHSHHQLHLQHQPQQQHYHHPPHQHPNHYSHHHPNSKS